MLGVPLPRAVDDRLVITGEEAGIAGGGGAQGVGDELRFEEAPRCGFVACELAATSSGVTGRPQPTRKVRRLGTSAACGQPGSVSNATS